VPSIIPSRDARACTTRQRALGIARLDRSRSSYETECLRASMEKSSCMENAATEIRRRSRTGARGGWTAKGLWHGNRRITPRSKRPVGQSSGAHLDRHDAPSAKRPCAPAPPMRTQWASARSRQHLFGGRPNLRVKYVARVVGDGPTLSCRTSVRNDVRGEQVGTRDMICPTLYEGCTKASQEPGEGSGRTTPGALALAGERQKGQPTDRETEKAHARSGENGKALGLGSGGFAWDGFLV